jgi:hypothetical protein
LAISQFRSSCEIDAKSHSNAVAAALEQDAGELFSEQHDVIGPFEHERLRGDCNVDGFDQRKPGGEGQARRGRVARAQLDQSASEKIPFGRDPGAALSSPARFLLERDQPVAFDQAFVGKNVGVGRAGALDDADSAQNKDPAARSVIAPIGPISR